MEGIIDVLPEDISNRIAAGEVVERPGSVVKELIENSVDAGASKIAVTVKGGGKRSIKVVDDGVGMIRSDAVLSLQRHATSKIRSDNDLFSISTMGFRGEALPSMASVSKMRIITSFQGEFAGTELVIDGGSINDVKDAPPAPGTSVELQDIFYNVPARLKFLKSDSTELSHITAAVTKVSLTRPSIAFKLINDKRVLLDLPSVSNPVERISSVFGKELCQHFIQVDGSTGGMKLTGFISNPVHNRGTRSIQYLYLNKRHIKDKSINHAIYEGYTTLLPKGRHPVFFLYLTLESNTVDVNVHPTKLEVRFSKGQEVHDFILHTIRKALRPEMRKQTENDYLPRSTYSPGANVERLHSPGNYAKESISHYSQPTQPPFQKLNAATPRYTIPAITKKDQGGLPFSQTSVPLPHKYSNKLKPQPESDITIEELQPIGQIFSSFLICEERDRLILIDQHAAHERILYERLLKRASDNSVAVQDLLLPIQIEVSSETLLLFSEKRADLEQLGFGVEHFGGNSLLLRSIPEFITDSDPQGFFSDILDAMIEIGKSCSIEDVVGEMVQVNSCRKAVKAGQNLNLAEMSALIKDLGQTERPYTCPHGRPIILSVTRDTILKSFLRK